MLLILSTVPMLCMLAGQSALAEEAPAASDPSDSTPVEVQEQKGMLEITSAVAADVYIDHEKVGKTPLKIELAEGKHLIRIAADDFDPFVRRVRIQANAAQKLDATLTPGKGSVEFQSPSPKASVQIDGQEPQKVPIRLNNIAVGKHTWSMSAPGYETKTGDFTFVPGHNLYIYPTLDSSAGLAEFHTTPAGADVFLNTMDAPIGQTPHKMEGLPPNTYTVVLKQKGYPAAIRKFDTRDGKKGVVQAGMGSLGANLVVKTNHAQAEVKLENMIIGSGKNVNFGKLERGVYNLVVSLPSGQSVSSKVQVPTKGDLTVLAKIYGDDSNKRSAIQIQPPLMSQWYFWASVGGAAVLTGVSTATVIQLNQPIPAEEGDVSVTLP